MTQSRTPSSQTSAQPHTRPQTQPQTQIPTQASAPVDALQDALAAEHAAVYVYGVLGGHTSASEQPALMRQVTDAYATHRLRRDHLTGVVAAALANTDEDPVGSEPGYRVPRRLGSATAIREAARGVEEACATSYAALVAAATADLRSWSITALTDAAVRGVGFAASPTPYPGLD